MGKPVDRAADQLIRARAGDRVYEHEGGIRKDQRGNDTALVGSEEGNRPCRLRAGKVRRLNHRSLPAMEAEQPPARSAFAHPGDGAPGGLCCIALECTNSAVHFLVEVEARPAQAACAWMAACNIGTASCRGAALCSGRPRRQAKRAHSEYHQYSQVPQITQERHFFSPFTVFFNQPKSLGRLTTAIAVASRRSHHVNLLPR